MKIGDNKNSPFGIILCCQNSNHKGALCREKLGEWFPACGQGAVSYFSCPSCGPGITNTFMATGAGVVSVGVTKREG